jgi:amino-acid N-acetyltransferase
MTLHIRREPELSTVTALLKAADLPTEDIAPDDLVHFYYAQVSGQVVGVIGVAPCGSDALLRSLAVSVSHRGRGHGTLLVNAAEKHAVKLGIRRLYLLTLTAEAFFNNRGFKKIRREKAPATIRRTAEFTHICPTSSILMFKPFAPAQGR